MVKKTARCPRCGEVDSAKLKTIEKLSEESKKLKIKIDKMLQEREKANKRFSEEVELMRKKAESILNNSHKTPYEKKIALFKVVEKMEVGDMPLEKKKRVNYILQAHLYS